MSQGWPAEESTTVFRSLERVRAHDFEKNSGYDGVADLQDDAWRVRTLAIRDLIRLDAKNTPAIIAGLADENRHVRHVAATALGVLGRSEAATALAKCLTEDTDPIMRGQAAEALGQIGGASCGEALQSALEHEKSDHVRHRIELALGQIKAQASRNSELLEAWMELDEKTFRQVEVGQAAPDFQLRDTAGNAWRLSDFKGEKSVALIWIFADWCPVCQREFYELTELEDRFKAADIQVLTIECHDPHRCKAIVGAYDRWWPHLVDPAGAVGAMYGVDPLEFVVHDEWINRPSVVMVDPDGIIRFAYYGTFWGDRPSIEQTLAMAETGSFAFVHPQRRK